MSAVGPPEAEQRELPDVALQFVAKFRRVRVDVGQLAAVGRIHRAWRDRDIGRRVHVVPPEELGAGERRVAPFRGIPDLLATHQVVGLTPEPDLGKIAEIPAVPDDAVLARQRARDEGGLHRGRDGRGHCRQRAQPAARRKRFQVRCVLEQRRRQSDDVQHERAFHDALPRRASELHASAGEAHESPLETLDPGPANILSPSRPPAFGSATTMDYRPWPIAFATGHGSFFRRFRRGRDRAPNYPDQQHDSGGTAGGQHPRQDALRP